jgi:hypothetical protein
MAWLGVLHAGSGAMVGGLTAAAFHGLRRWDRPEITVLVKYASDVGPVPGIRFVRTRRSMADLREPTSSLPIARLEPAVLMAAATESSTRTAQGLLASVVQQDLSTAERLTSWVFRLRPLRRSRLLLASLVDIGGGAQSISEIDVARMCRRFGLAAPRRQVKRRDAYGRQRYTDCEWELPDSRVVVLEVDGAFHMEIEHWEDDIVRHRQLTRPGRIMVRCTAREMRDEPKRVFDDLVALGVPRIRRAT